MCGCDMQHPNPMRPNNAIKRLLVERQDKMRAAILGNSGSGKSTLAKRIASRRGAAVLDLDTIAWVPGRIAVSRPVEEAIADVRAFCGSHQDWVIEGCYANLIAASLTFDPVLVLLDPGLEQCVANCKARPWEPHKYASEEEQGAKLPFLLSWVAEYYARDGDMSCAGHEALFRGYPGAKHRLRQLPDEGLSFLEEE
jgi:adenylate kinase family enzyme